MNGAVLIFAYATSTVAGTAHAQNFPVKPVRIIIGFSAGSSTDTVARVIAQKLNQSWGQPVIIENRVGAGGNIAAEVVAKASADGYTLLFANNGLAISATLYRKLPYDAERDLEAVTQVTAMPHVLLANQNLAANSIKELVALAKSKPGQLSFGSAGTGNSDHMAGELFKYLAGIDLAHVPYKGGPQALTDTVNGQVSMYFGGLPVALPMVKAGRVKALGTSGAKRSPALPDVPTIAEAGVPGYEVSLWYGLLAPARTPKDIVAKISADVARALKSPETQERFNTLGVETVGSTPDQFSGFIKSELGKWGKVVKATGITVE
jgi:tripartite-type tricarboxylate transporter receptor subunit TctC